MVVDGEPAVLRLAKRVLEKSRFEVVLAKDTPEALGRLTHHTVHALLADVGLPDPDVWELIKEARGRYPELPICCMAPAIVDPHPIFQDVPLVMKPFEPRRLIEIVKQTITMYKRMQKAKTQWLASRRELDAIVSEGPVAIPQADRLFRFEQVKRRAAAELTNYQYELLKYRNEMEKYNAGFNRPQVLSGQEGPET